MCCHICQTVCEFKVTQTGRAGGWGEEEATVPKTLSGSSHTATEECSEGTGLLTLRPVHFAGHQAVLVDKTPHCYTPTSEAVLHLVCPLFFRLLN